MSELCSKGPSINNLLDLASMGRDRVVPFPVKGIPLQVDGRHLLVSPFDASRVGLGVEDTLHRQACGRGGCRDQAENHGLAHQGLATPVLANEREQAMLDLVPLARARWEVAEADGQARLVGQPL